MTELMVGLVLSLLLGVGAYRQFTAHASRQFLSVKNAALDAQAKQAIDKIQADLSRIPFAWTNSGFVPMYSNEAGDTITFVIPDPTNSNLFKFSGSDFTSDALTSAAKDLAPPNPVPSNWRLEENDWVLVFKDNQYCVKKVTDFHWNGATPSISLTDPTGDTPPEDSGPANLSPPGNQPIADLTAHPGLNTCLWATDTKWNTSVSLFQKVIPITYKMDPGSPPESPPFLVKVTNKVETKIAPVTNLSFKFDYKLPKSTPQENLPYTNLSACGVAISLGGLHGVNITVSPYIKSEPNASANPTRQKPPVSLKETFLDERKGTCGNTPPELDKSGEISPMSAGQMAIENYADGSSRLFIPVADWGNTPNGGIQVVDGSSKAKLGTDLIRFSTVHFGSSNDDGDNIPRVFRPTTVSILGTPSDPKGGLIVGGYIEGLRNDLSGSAGDCPNGCARPFIGYVRRSTLASCGGKITAPGEPGSCALDPNDIHMIRIYGGVSGSTPSGMFDTTVLTVIGNSTQNRIYIAPRVRHSIEGGDMFIYSFPLTFNGNNINSRYPALGDNVIIDDQTHPTNPTPYFPVLREAPGNNYSTITALADAGTISGQRYLAISVSNSASGYFNGSIRLAPIYPDGTPATNFATDQAVIANANMGGAGMAVNGDGDLFIGSRLYTEVIKKSSIEAILAGGSPLTTDIDSQAGDSPDTNGGGCYPPEWDVTSSDTGSLIFQILYRNRGMALSTALPGETKIYLANEENMGATNFDLSITTIENNPTTTRLLANLIPNPTNFSASNVGLAIGGAVGGLEDHYPPGNMDFCALHSLGAQNPPPAVRTSSDNVSCNCLSLVNLLKGFFANIGGTGPGGGGGGGAGSDGGSSL